MQQQIIILKKPLLVLLLLFFILYGEAQYKLLPEFTGKDSAFESQALKLKTSFVSRQQCEDYIKTIVSLMNNKGYLEASVDEVLYDSIAARVSIYTGKKYKWLQLRTDSIDKPALDRAGPLFNRIQGSAVDFARLEYIKKQVLDYYASNGYPFAAIRLDSIGLLNGSMHALLKLSRGPLYHIDSIRNRGTVKISNTFLQRFLGLPKGCLYNREKLEGVGKKLLSLPYLQEIQPSELIMLGTGSVLNLYLQPKRSSQFNFLVGFLPSSGTNNKLQLTGDVNLNLKNALGGGETILLNWQQLQLKSPRLTVGYQQPYIFKSPFGFDFSFELFKKDSSFLQLNTQAGIQYLLSLKQSGKLFFQNQQSILLGSGVDTNVVKATRKLPPNVDVSAVSIGVDYEFNNTDYRYNPVSGNECRIILAAGLKTIRRNNDILSLKDPTFNFATLYDSIRLKSYQLRLKLSAAHYFRTGKQSTVKTTASLGIFQSPHIFRNELFQIGGFRLLRGFNEESIYATQYAVLSGEFRYLIARNSYLFGFADGGWVRNNYQLVDISNRFLGAGIGMVFETKLGLLNMSLAAGSRNDVPFNLRQSAKIHFGYITYF